MIPSLLAPRPARRAAHARRLGRALVLGLVLCGSLLASRLDALAHARLNRSIPAAGALLASSPTSIELWFNELLDDEFNDVAVFRAAPDGAPADDTNLARGKPHVDDADRTHLVADVTTLAPGAYVVQWKVLSRDGHSARGRVPFRVAAAE